MGGGRFESGALWTEDGVIVAWTDGDEPRGLPGGWQEIDLDGGTLLPGFHDAHVHPLMAGEAMLGVDFSPMHSRGEYLDTIRAFADDNPDVPVIEGFGWFGDVFPGGFPTAAELDQVLPSRPAVLNSHDGHGVWVNSRTLELAGISATTPDPPDGRIQRDASGRPTGMLLEAAIELVRHLLPVKGLDHQVEALRRAQERLHSCGIVGWQDAAIGSSLLGPDALPAYLELARRGELSARVVGAQWWDPRQDPDVQLVRLRERRSSVSDLPGLRLDAVKLMHDGMVENGTAAMLSPLCGREDVGISYFEPAQLKSVSRLVAAEGYQLHYHAVGDRAVRECLDAVASLPPGCRVSSRMHHIAHLDVVHPQDLARFAELGCAANIQPLWARRDEEILTRKLPLLGETRNNQHFPFGSLARADATLVGGSDWPVTDPNPLWGMYTAVTRTAPREDPHAIGPEACTVPLLPDEAITLGQAMDAYTCNAARLNAMGEAGGTLSVSVPADLVWVDRDVSDVMALGGASVVGTWVDGERVFTA
jgi:predicted amidohydrolase YtcJ